MTTLTTTIPPELADKRLDQAMAILFPDYSRNQHQEWIKKNTVKLDGKIVDSPKHKVKAEQVLEIEAVLTPQMTLKAEAIPLDVVYEDADILVINKPAGLIVHPGAGNPEHTLVNALLHHAPALAELPRAGVVHRLDKDTSGLLVVGKTPVAQLRLVRDLAKRKVTREYEAVAHGKIISGGTVDESMARHPIHRTKMAVRSDGRKAITHYRVLQKFSHHTHLKLILETGRTHQIRVHLQHIRHPIVGDKTYGLRTPTSVDKLIPRQALHAKRLALHHPITGVWMEWETELPQDFQTLLQKLSFIE